MRPSMRNEVKWKCGSSVTSGSDVASLRTVSAFMADQHGGGLGMTSKDTSKSISP
jgi:hypothetical protein